MSSQTSGLKACEGRVERSESLRSVTLSSGAQATVTWTADHAHVALTGEVDECFSATGASVIRCSSRRTDPSGSTSPV